LIDNPPDTLIQAALHHDDPEKWLGDMPFTAKRDFPELAAAYARAESEVIAREGIPQPANEWEARVVKFVDRLDAYFWAVMHARQEVMAGDDWTECAGWLDVTANQLGIDGGKREVVADAWYMHVEASK
jgi:5'-deoxynucleotidase YfbR-like HD superfamily hydrolase